MSKIVISVILLSVTTAVVVAMVTLSAGESYLQERDVLLTKEEDTFLGHAVTLTPKELRVDRILLDKKGEELTLGYKNSSEFLPSLHFLEAKARIDRSEVFEFMRRVPKGASLHTHLLAAVNVDFIIENFTHRENLFGGYVNEVFKLKFLKNAGDDARTQWTSVEELRAQKGTQVFDQWLKNQLMLNQDHENVESVWKKFKRIFTTTYDFFSYKSIFQEYVTQLLQELYDDNVMYTELKGTIMPLYDLNTTYSKEEFFEIFIKAVEDFKKGHPKFLGVKYIHSVYRGVDGEVLHNSLEEIIRMKALFPEFIAGFDFVGFEEEGKTLLDYRLELLDAQKDLKFFFHAGETPWFGHTDLNLVDALLLGSTRIGHGFAITKHPKLLDLGKQRNIPMEICPISNQILMLNQDPRTHPAATLMALDYPIVIGNDDPSIWNATGLSYDWYVLFMAMTPKGGGLEILKQLAMNSIKFSVMEEDEKTSAMQQWERMWDRFLDEILAGNDAGSDKAYQSDYKL